MKNNKGFTLIELIATVILLALVYGIARVSYDSVVYENQDNIFRNNVRNIFDTIRTINVTEFNETEGCIRDLETRGISLTGSWSLDSNGNINVYNVSDGKRSLVEVNEENLKDQFEIKREAMDETCE